MNDSTITKTKDGLTVTCHPDGIVSINGLSVVTYYLNEQGRLDFRPVEFSYFTGLIFGSGMTAEEITELLKEQSAEKPETRAARLEAKDRLLRGNS